MNARLSSCPLRGGEVASSAKSYLLSASYLNLFYVRSCARLRSGAIVSSTRNSFFTYVFAIFQYFIICIYTYIFLFFYYILLNICYELLYAVYCVLSKEILKETL